MDVNLQVPDQEIRKPEPDPPAGEFSFGFYPRRLSDKKETITLRKTFFFFYKRDVSDKQA